MFFSTSCKHEQKLQLAYTFLCDSVDVLMCELFFSFAHFLYCGLYPIQPRRPISRLETYVKTRKNDLKVDIELCASNPYFDICQQTSDKAIVTEACFLKKPVSCRSCMTHAELPCRLPFASPPLFCASSHLWSISLCIPTTLSRPPSPPNRA